MQRNSRWSVVLLALLSCSVWATNVHGENYAFLVAVQDYDVKDLKKLNCTRSDIDEFAEVLRRSGFKSENIVVLNDKPEKARYLAESRKIRTELDLVLAAVEAGDTLIIAFSGHGVQFEGDEKNYYCPLDADLDDPKRGSLIPLSELYDKLKQSPAAKKLLLVDACRNDPLSVVKKSRATVNLKSVTRPQAEPVPKGVVALFSCSAGQESYEWPELRHGVFFYHVLEGWNGAASNGDQQVTLDGIVAYSRQKTQAFARLNLKALQTPQLKSDFDGTWVLRKFVRGEEPEITNRIGMKLCWVPAGNFLMGNEASVEELLRLFPTTTNEQAEDAKLRHPIQITKGFHFGKFEVTRGQFRKFVDETGYRTEPERDGQGGYGYDAATDTLEGRKPKYNWRNAGFEQTDEHPAVNVTWNDAVKFCEWLSKLEGKTYRLPTEAEWEYACRAGSKTRYQGGDDPETLADVGNVADGKFKYTVWPTIRARDGYVFTAPVGQFRANSFGLHDMHGNVWEWCSDWYDASYYEHSPNVDPQGPAKGSFRVDRGGSWNHGPFQCRPASRESAPESGRGSYLGFRVVQVR